MFKILVAEDDASTNRLFCAILRRAGYEPIQAVDGEDALQKLDEYKVDLLLCDVMMPRLDGFALTRMIRDSGSLLPVLMVTARALPADKRQGFLVGTDNYITKPVDKEEMLLRIKALLRRARIVDERRGRARLRQPHRAPRPRRADAAAQRVRAAVQAAGLPGPHVHAAAAAG